MHGLAGETIVVLLPVVLLTAAYHMILSKVPVRVRIVLRTTTAVSGTSIRSIEESYYAAFSGFQELCSP